MGHRESHNNARGGRDGSVEVKSENTNLFSSFVLTLILTIGALSNSFLLGASTSQPKIVLTDTKLSFLDSNGKETKMIQISGFGSILPSSNIYKKKHPRLKEPHLFGKNVMRWAHVTADKSHVIIFEQQTEYIHSENHQEHYANIGEDESLASHETIVKYFTRDGTEVWSKILPNGEAIIGYGVSGNGNVIAIVLRPNLESNLPIQLYAINNLGEIVFVFPASAANGTSGLAYEGPYNVYLSHAGRYLVAPANDKSRYFFDIMNKTIWKTAGKARCTKIDDNGIAVIRYYAQNTAVHSRPAPNTTEKVDLTQFLGK